MYIVKTNEFGKYASFNEFGDEQPIHIVHCSETIDDLKDDIATPFLVAESCTNFARLHLVTDFSPNEAFQQVCEYLIEEEGIDEPNLTAVFEVKI